MNKEEYLEMLILDLESKNLAYWESTQDEMAEALRELQQENQSLKDRIEKAIEKVNNIYFELKCKEASLYLRLKDIEQGKDLLEILKGDKE